MGVYEEIRLAFVPVVVAEFNTLALGVGIVFSFPSEILEAESLSAELDSKATPFDKASFDVKERLKIAD